jgi:hypothetical protein
VSRIGTPLGTINVKYACLEVMDFDMCNAYFQEREARLKSRSKVHQTIKWPSGATSENAFGLRTADRVWFMVTSSNKAAEWLEILRGFIGENQPASTVCDCVSGVVPLIFIGGQAQVCVDGKYELSERSRSTNG